jgi:putative ATP-dependent endonuclease of OLD family
VIKKIKICGYRIYKELSLEPNQKLNLIVGGNETGKSTLLEAISLALTGRVNGRKASEELNPYWFNTNMVNKFVRLRREGKPAAFPEISIELFLHNRDDLQQLCGAINSEVPTDACPGVSMRILPNPEYKEELEDWAKGASSILPVEYYMDDWRTFADEKLTFRPKQLATAVIDSRTLRSTSGIDYHLREILSEHLETSERASISLAYRKVKANMSEGALKDVNKRIDSVHASLHNRPISLAMDQSARTSWETSITPHVDNIPFSMSGQGQQAAIKISLAMNKHADRANFVMVEEPENHLSHTSLNILLSRIQDLSGPQQQIFISTHNSFVLNRLGLDSIILLGNGAVSKIPELNSDTVKYFKKLPGYDTLRLVLADKIVLVEGPSDEIIFERIFKDIFDQRPIECGIDVVSMRGLSLKRCLELCSLLDKKVAALRDNDGIEPAELYEGVEEWLEKSKRQLFIGAIADGNTLEPQLVNFNGEENIRTLLKVQDNVDLAKWMKREKTECAIRIAEADEKITPPEYMRQAAHFIHE